MSIKITAIKVTKLRATPIVRRQLRVGYTFLFLARDGRIIWAGTLTLRSPEFAVEVAPAIAKELLRLGVTPHREIKERYGVERKRHTCCQQLRQAA